MTVATLSDKANLEAPQAMRSWQEYQEFVTELHGKAGVSMKSTILGLFWAEFGSDLTQDAIIFCEACTHGTLVSKTDEFCIINEEFCIKNEELCS